MCGCPCDRGREGNVCSWLVPQFYHRQQAFLLLGQRDGSPCTRGNRAIGRKNAWCVTPAVYMGRQTEVVKNRKRIREVWKSGRPRRGGNQPFVEYRARPPPTREISPFRPNDGFASWTAECTNTRTNPYFQMSTFRLRHETVRPQNTRANGIYPSTPTWNPLGDCRPLIVETRVQR